MAKIFFSEDRKDSAIIFEDGNIIWGTATPEFFADLLIAVENGRITDEEFNRIGRTIDQKEEFFKKQETV